jgi:hypothetical protein
MDELQSISQNMEVNRSTVRPIAFAVQEFRRTATLRMYRQHADDATSSCNRIEARILCAMTRWLSAGNVRIEFYSVGTSGELRVRVIDKGGPETLDMSLTRFVGSSPVTH